MKNKIIFKAIVGSQAYGTAVEGSDIDIKGVYIQDPNDILTFNYEPQINVNKDETYYEVRRFIELLASANPTVLELLYTPDDCVLEKDPIFDLIISNRGKFLTKKCKWSFGGYAIEQIKKARGLNKKMNWEDSQKMRKTPLDFCYITDDSRFNGIPLTEYLEKFSLDQAYCGLSRVEHFRDVYNLSFDYVGYYANDPYGFKGIVLPDSTSIRVSEVPKEFDILGKVFYNKDAYVQHCRDFLQYQTWMKERNTQRYVDIEGHGQKIDGKNMLHCTRLIETALEIAQTGTLNVRRDNAAELIDIRKGKVDLETILQKAEANLELLDGYFENSSLPDNVDKDFYNDLLLQIRNEYK